MDCRWCAFATFKPGLPACRETGEPAEPDGYVCSINGQTTLEGDLPADCPDFAWCEELAPLHVSDIYV